MAVEWDLHELAEVNTHGGAQVGEENRKGNSVEAKCTEGQSSVLGGVYKCTQGSDQECVV